MVNEATPAPSEMISEHHPCRARAIASIIDDLDGVLDGLIQRRGIYTGFKEVDELISGLQPDHLYIVGARPSMGKTSFVLNITEHVALRESTTVLYFTLGQSPAQLAQAMLCSHARVNSNKIRRGEIFDYERVRLKESANALRGAKVIFEDLSAATTADLYQSIRRTKITDDVGLVVIDDMQSVRADCVRTAADSCEQEVAEIVRGLKKIAVELKLPIVLTSQINRRTDRRQDRRPLLSDLQGSGAIEELADVVLLLYREGYYDPRAGVNHPCEVIVGKNRWGPTGTANLTFLKEFTRFQDF